MESVGLPYAVVGGLAVSAWATPRATQDVDLYAELPDATRPSLERALRERGFDVPAMRRRQRATIARRTLWVIAPEDLAILKAFSDRPRDFLDLVVLLKRTGASLDIAYVEEWAKALDASVGTDEVSERVRRALASRAEG